MSVNNRGKKIHVWSTTIRRWRTVLAEQLDLYDGFTTTIQVSTAAEGG